MHHTTEAIRQGDKPYMQHSVQKVYDTDEVTDLSKGRTYALYAMGDRKPVSLRRTPRVAIRVAI